jgi:hypothetical protein
MQTPLLQQRDPIGFPEYYEPSDYSVSPSLRASGVFGYREHWRNMPFAFIGSFTKEVLSVMLITLGILVFVITSTTTDTLSKFFVVGIIAFFGYLVSYKMGNVPGVPRHAHIGITTFEFLSGRVTLLNLLSYLASGVLGAVFTGLILSVLPGMVTGPITSRNVTAPYTPVFGAISVAVPLVGTFSSPWNQGTTVTGATFVVILCSMVIVLVQGHFISYLQLGSPRHMLKCRGTVAAMVNALMIAIAYAAYGVWALDGWVYFAGAFATIFSKQAGVTSVWNQDGSLFQSAPYSVSAISGIAAMWILAPAAGGVLAFFVDWIVVMLEQKLGVAAGSTGFTSRTHIAAPASSSSGGGGRGSEEDYEPVSASLGARSTPMGTPLAAPISSKAW